VIGLNYQMNLDINKKIGTIKKIKNIELKERKHD
jgi:hypothetical protein